MEFFEGMKRKKSTKLRKAEIFFFTKVPRSDKDMPRAWLILLPHRVHKIFACQAHLFVCIFHDLLLA